MVIFEETGFTYESLNEKLSSPDYSWDQNFTIIGDKDAIDNYDKRYREEASKLPWLNNNSYILESPLEVKTTTIQFKVLDATTYYLENEELDFEELKNRIVDKDSKEFKKYLVYCSEESFNNCIKQNESKYSCFPSKLEQNKEMQDAMCIKTGATTYSHKTQNYRIILQVKPNYGI